MPLDIATYKKNEIAGSLQLGARAVQSFAPVTFEHIGYPSRVTDESQILWYLDAMHEDCDQPAVVYADEFLVSTDEMELINEVGDLIEELTEEQFGNRIRPWVSPLFSLQMFRVIQSISEFTGQKASVFEMGPGSGYLGALLIRAGHRYISTDVAEGFYLWQSRMFEKLAPGEFTEMAEDDDFSALEDPGSRVVHVPWWRHASYYKFGCPFSVSTVVADHALGEMTNLGMQYAIKSGLDMLVGAGLRTFITTSIGMPNVSELSTIIVEFYSKGYLPLMVHGPLAFVPAMSQYSYLGIGPEDLQEELAQPGSKRPMTDPVFDIARQPAYYSKSGEPDLMPANKGCLVDWNHAPRDYEFMKYIGAATP